MRVLVHFCQMPELVGPKQPASARSLGRCLPSKRSPNILELPLKILVWQSSDWSPMGRRSATNHSFCLALYARPEYCTQTRPRVAFKSSKSLYSSSALSVRRTRSCESSQFYRGSLSKRTVCASLGALLPYLPVCRRLHRSAVVLPPHSHCDLTVYHSEPSRIHHGFCSFCRSLHLQLMRYLVRLHPQNVGSLFEKSYAIIFDHWPLARFFSAPSSYRYGFSKFERRRKVVSSFRQWRLDCALTGRAFVKHFGSFMARSPS